MTDEAGSQLPDSQTQAKRRSVSESKYKSFSQIVSQPEGLITWQSLEDRTYRQLYLEILGRLQIDTDCKSRVARFEASHVHF